MIKHILGNRVLLTPFASKSLSGISVIAPQLRSKTIFTFSSGKNTQDEELAKIKNDQTSEEAEQYLGSEFSKEDYQYFQNVNEADWQSFLAEQVELEKGKSRAQNVLNEKGQKIIYQSAEQQIHVLRYQILAAVFGLATLYLLYRGDAMYKTIVLVPAVGLGAFAIAKHNQALRQVPVVRQILQTQYKTYDIVFERNKVLSTIENIAHEQIKLTANARQAFSLPYDQYTGNFLTNRGLVLSVGDTKALLPLEYQGNALDFNRFLGQH